jgi:hypothetical protein
LLATIKNNDNDIYLADFIFENITVYTYSSFEKWQANFFYVIDCSGVLNLENFKVINI